jgi:hypothetical protein
MEELLNDIYKLLSTKFNYSIDDFEEIHPSSFEFFYKEDEVIFSSLPPSIHSIVDDDTRLALAPLVLHGEDMTVNLLMQLDGEDKSVNTAIYIINEDCILVRFALLSH